MLSRLSKISFFFIATLAVALFFFLRLPATLNATFSLACIKNSFFLKRIPGAPQRSMGLWPLLKLDAAERLHFGLGLKKPESLHVGPYHISFNSCQMMKSLLAEVFINQEYAMQLSNTSNPFIIDCGANIGATTLFLKLMYPGARVLAFEPEPENIALLQKNMQSNNISGVTLVPKAVYDRETVLEFAISGSTTGSLSINAIEKPTKVIHVQTTPLSPYVDRTVDLLKMDIEGAETAVLEELDAQGKIPLIKQMIFEFHYHRSDSNKLDDVLRILRKHSFHYELYSNRGFAAQQLPTKQADDGLRLLMIFAYQKSELA